jgi:hypothetical protein
LLGRVVMDGEVGARNTTKISWLSKGGIEFIDENGPASGCANVSAQSHQSRPLPP